MTAKDYLGVFGVVVVALVLYVVVMRFEAKHNALKAAAK